MENELSSTAETPNVTQIEHVDDVLGLLKELHMTGSYADVIFVVQSQRIPAHRAILAARSEYFRGLLFGELEEAQQREINLDFEPEAFREMLNYIYAGCVSIKTTADHITRTLEILELARFLMLTKLESDITEVVKRDLALDNVTHVLNYAQASHFDELSSACLHLLDNWALDYIQHESFEALSKTSLETILQRDSFAAPEVGIFHATMAWHIRLSVMGDDEMVNVVKPTEVFHDDDLFAAIVARTQAKNLPYRWFNSNNKRLSFVSKSTKHTEDGKMFTVAELAMNSYINHIHGVLNEGLVGYTLEVSQNNIQWEQVIDYMDYECEKTQELYFAPRPVRYIKFRWNGSQCNIDANDIRALEAFQLIFVYFKVLDLKTSYARFSEEVPELIDGIVAPIENVVTSTNATFLDCHFKAGVINAWMSQFINHRSIKFNQPYHIGSLRHLVTNFITLKISRSITGMYWREVYSEQAGPDWTHCAFEPNTVLYVKCEVHNITTLALQLALQLEIPSQDPEFVAQQKENRRLRASQL